MERESGFPPRAALFDADRDEAAISRLYGGIHYRSDIELGKDHGMRVGGYTSSFARIDGADLQPQTAVAGDTTPDGQPQD